MNTDNQQLDKPQTLRGFSDWFAPDVRQRQFVINTFVKTFEKYGYEPLETPALEYSQFMLGISGEEAEKQFYRFKDQGGRDVMLKYEVMTAMCRAVAANFDKVVFPYKRYQIQPVWRAENTQKGRYRQFTQCDADTIGSPSMLVDAEFIQMGLEITSRLGFKKFFAKVSNRKFLEGLAKYFQIPDSQFYGLCMSLDKLVKIGSKAVIDELVEKRGLDLTTAQKILDLINPDKFSALSNDKILAAFQSNIGQTEIGRQALDELSQIFEFLAVSSVDPQLYRFDPSLARGLASYTGPVWEFEVIDGGVGSIAGCGRYDNVIGRYLKTDKLIPATGGSFGIERICDIIKGQNLFSPPPSPTKALVTIFSEEFLAESLKIANALRSSGIPVLLYPDSEKLSKQFKYADAKQIPYALVIGPDEKAKNVITIKSLESQTQQSLPLDQIITMLK
ncbi:MAG: histidine--tRNA ligase [Candidatus Shapirobacteria bacterium]|jgi:histidyl-tRNA synthetase